MCPRRNPAGGRLRVFEKMPSKSKTFFRFWDTDASAFRDVLVCPLYMYTARMKHKPLSLLGVYVPRSKRIYYEHDAKTFFHEASHHVLSMHMPSLYKTARGRAIEEAVADIAAVVSVKKMQVPRGVGWSLIEMGLHLKQCYNLHLDKDGDPVLGHRCILAAVRARPKLITRLF